MEELTLTVTDEIVANIRKEVVGEGGFQDLMRDLQRRLEGTTLRLARDLVEKIFRYADDYSQGGFQERLRPLADLLRSSDILGE